LIRAEAAEPTLHLRNTGVGLLSTSDLYWLFRQLGARLECPNSVINLFSKALASGNSTCSWCSTTLFRKMRWT
jgi:hypothetical protein